MAQADVAFTGSSSLLLAGCRHFAVERERQCGAVRADRGVLCYPRRGACFLEAIAHTPADAVWSSQTLICLSEQARSLISVSDGEADAQTFYWHLVS